MISFERGLGAVHLGDGRTRFEVWAPNHDRVEVKLLGPEPIYHPLRRRSGGLHRAIVEGAPPGTDYLFRLDGERELPDPASRFQPDGIFGPSRVIDPEFEWHDECWRGLPLEQYILYEIHVGTFTPEGTFDAAIGRLDHLVDLGVTAIELMPIAQFAGARNWGYDGAFSFAAQNTYGGPEGLRRLVDAAHVKGLAVALDVVFNHLGPEGNVLPEYGPYLTENYKTLWGAGVNFDDRHSEGVRRYFIESALYWTTDCHIDMLRLDAVDRIVDMSATPFLAELGEVVHEQGDTIGRRLLLVCESAANDPRLVLPTELGGHGLDAQWNDEFHHSLRTLITGDLSGYYVDYGRLRHLMKAYRTGYVYTGQYSTLRERRHGASSRDVPAERLVIFSQNHDHVGNRMLGERLSQLQSFEDLKLVAGIVLLAPFIPLLFMGEEYGDTSPFLYFSNCCDPKLAEAVREGRKRDFAYQGEPPDPQVDETFLRSKLHFELREQGDHKLLLEFYRQLIRLRKSLPALARLSKDRIEVSGYEDTGTVFIWRWERGQVVQLLNLGKEETTERMPFPRGRWTKALDSADVQWRGPGALARQDVETEKGATVTLPARSFALYRLIEEDGLVE